MQGCSRCFYLSDHPLGITFDDEGVCSGCRIHDEKYNLDWKERESELKKLLKDYRSFTNYDCIVPVSGSGDSFFVVENLKNRFGMNPLLVTYNNHFNTSVGIRNIAQMKRIFDCDLMMLTVNPVTVRKITRETLLRRGSIYWQSIAGQTVFPVQLACKLKIPLIIWGAHQGVDQVGMFSHNDKVEMSRRYRHEHDLMGLEAEDLLGGYESLTEAEISPFAYPDDEQIATIGVRGIYLNNYLFWNSRLQHEEMIAKYGYESMKQTRTFDIYSNSSCWIYSDLHDYVKFIKYGVGKVVDHATREFRLGQMTRNEGIELILKYLHRPPLHHLKFLEWIGITETAFKYLIDQHRNLNHWIQNDDLQWVYAGVFSEGLTSDENDDRKVYKPYASSPKGISTDRDDALILIGKGTP
jgi:N-acetyl sugar amidotransferase